MINKNSLLIKTSQGELQESVKKDILQNAVITEARVARSATLVLKAKYKNSSAIKSSTTVIHEGEEFTRTATRKSEKMDSKYESTTIPHSPKLYTMDRHLKRGATALSSFATL